MPLENRERVLRAATDSFLARGYASSVDDIARRAGVAKQTVYSHFASKERLFREVARGLAMSVLVELEGGDPRAALLRFAIAYRERALGAQGIATFRTLVPAVPRFKGLAKVVYANTMGEMVTRIAEYLGAAMREGRPRLPRPHREAVRRADRPRLHRTGPRGDHRAPPSLRSGLGT